MSGFQAKEGTSQTADIVRGAACTISPLASRLLKKDAKETFTNNIYAIYGFWIKLLIDTTLPSDISQNDHRIANAMRQLDQVIARTDRAESRIGSALLARLLSTLQERIRLLRQRGEYFAKRKCSSIVIDSYATARNLPLDKTSRSRTLYRIRMSKRWSALAGNYPLLLATLSDEAEGIIGNLNVSNQALRDLATQLHTSYPPELRAVADYMEGFREELSNIGIGELREHAAGGEDIQEKEQLSKERQDIWSNGDRNT